MLIDSNRPLKTALHGWACQLIACPCGCRSHPLSFERLKAKGLFGALLPSTRLIESGSSQIRTFRALLGCIPLRERGQNLRFCISGLGQMASPMQSLWIVSQYHRHVCQHFGFPCLFSPESNMWTQIGDVMTELNFQIPGTLAVPRTVQFLDDVYQTLTSSYGDLRFDKGLWYISVEQTPNTVTESDERFEGFEIFPEDSDNGPSPILANSDPYLLPIGDWECDGIDCPVCGPIDGSEVMLNPHLTNLPSGNATELASTVLEHRIVDAVEGISPTLTFTIRDESQFDTIAPSEPLVVFPPSGGIPGFANKRLVSSASGVVEPSAKRIKTVASEATMLPTEPVTPFESDSVVTENCDASDRSTHADVKQVDSVPLLLGPQVSFSKTGSFPLLHVNNDQVQDCHLVTVHSADSAPLSIGISQGSTVGDLLVAWNKLESTDDILRASSMVGSLLSNHDPLTHSEIVVVPMKQFVS